MNNKYLLQLGLMLAIISSPACQRSFAKLDLESSFRSTASASSPMTPAPKIVDKEFEQYRQQVLQKFREKDFSWIDREAHKARVSKERLPGGYWKLRAVYAALEEPPLQDNATDGDWEDLLQELSAWSKAKPDSVTAKVALASAWKGYAWKARGKGYSDAVTDIAWQVFGKRLDSARQALIEASSLEERCPFWFVTAMWVGIGQGWDRGALDKIFDAGEILEPTFYYIYQTKATYLLPRWGGRDGEWERFAETSALKLGGNQGDIVFFGIYSQMLTMHGHSLMNTHQKDVPKLIAGFRSIEKLYGASAHRLNEACFFSSFGNDLATTGEFFTRIGENYDESVWRSKKNFDIYRQGYELRAKSTQVQPQNSTRPTTQTPPQN